MTSQVQVTIPIHGRVSYYSFVIKKTIDLKEKKIKNKLKKMSLEALAASLSIAPEELKSYCHQKGIKLTSKDISAADNTADFSWTTWFNTHKKIIMFLVGLVAFAYINTFNNAFVSDDIFGLVDQDLSDFSLVTSNPLQAAKPLMNFFTQAFFGKEPWAFRLPNIAAHAGVVLVIYLLISLLVNTHAAIFAAVLTAVHPLLTESVTWISGGGYVSYTFFCLLSLLFFILRSKSKLYYGLSVISFLAALMFSEKAAMFPGVLFVYLILFENIFKNWKVLIPYFTLSAIWMIVYIGMIPMRQELLSTNYSAGNKQSLSPFISIPVSVSSYLSLFIWPDKLSLYHSGVQFSWVDFGLRLIALALYLVSLVRFYWLSRRKHPFMKHVVFWMSIFLISLLPTFVPGAMAWTVAERYAYLATVGMIVTTAIFLDRLRQKLNRPDEAYIIFGLAAILLLGRTILRNNDWQDADHLWLSAARTSPNSHQNNNNLGDLYSRRGDYEKAIYHFTKATELDPCYGDGYHNLANTYVELGKYEEAIENYHKALECKPILWESHHHLALIYAKLKDFANANLEIDKALQINPKNPILQKLKADLNHN